jgi:hypothetical protein
MTNQNKELLESVTQQLQQLQISQFHESLGNGQDHPREPVEAKRTRIDGEAFSSHLANRVGFFNPLLFLRANQPQPDETPLSPISNPDRHSSPSILEEIVNSNSGGLLLEPNKRVSKTPRPVERQRKEPAKSSSATLPVSVLMACQKHKVEYSVIKLSKTFRSLVFSRTRVKSDYTDPWEEFKQLNKLKRFQLSHALYYGFTSMESEEEERLIVIVPHTSKSKGETDIERVSSEISASSVRRITLTHMEKELGFPTFICPPFGHEYAPNLQNSQRVIKFTTLIDSVLIRPEGPDCVFDLGLVCVRLRPSELGRLANRLGWKIVDNLVKCHS